MSANYGNLSINGDRLWASLAEMARIGATPKGGCNRQTLTDLDREGRRLFARWCEAAGMTVTVDSMGNMFARRPGTEAGLDPVAAGSHLDTQPTGGKYDGVLGVLGALELVRTLNDLGIRTRRPIEIVNWTNEEGTRFAPAMLASGVFAGVYDEAWAKARLDVAGLPFGDELRRIGYQGPEPVGLRKFHALYELHIEQGPILEAEGVDIGIVTLGQGFRWLELTVTGMESHSGSTPMPRRRDALAGVAEIVSAVERIARSHPPHAVGTVGFVTVEPNSRNIIPGRVCFSIDFRHPVQATIDAMTRELEDEARRISAARRLDIGIDEVGAFEPVAFDRTCAERLRRAADAFGLRHREMVSGAGHDACYVARVAPTAMVFCPCVDGLSHNEAEAIKPEWATAGANVLLRAVVETAEIVT